MSPAVEPSGRPLCLRCAHAKPGPLGPCPGCEHVPVDVVDQARHLVAAELGAEAWSAMRASVLAGEEPELDPTAVAEASAAVEAATPARVALFAFVLVALPVLASVGALVLVAMALLLL